MKSIVEEFNERVLVVTIPATEVDVLDMVDGRALSKRLIFMMGEIRQAAEKLGKTTYMVGFKRKRRNTCLILEKRFVNWLYFMHNVSIRPWLAFQGHVIVPAAQFMDAVDPELLRCLPDELPQSYGRD